MAEGNGVDLASIYQLLAHVAKRQVDDGARLEQMEREFVVMRWDISDLKHGIANLNQTVALYHASVMGHGIMLTEHDERIVRLEDRAAPRPHS